MAKGKKTGGRDFKKGNSGGPGRPALTEIEKAARNASRREIAELYQRFKGLTPDEATKLLAAKKTTLLERAFLVSLLRMGDPEDGDLTELHRMYDRLLGKSRQAVEHTGEGGEPLAIEVVIVQGSKDQKAG